MILWDNRCVMHIALADYDLAERGRCTAPPCAATRRAESPPGPDRRPRRTRQREK
jgi:hypothetical protein